MSPSPKFTNNFSLMILLSSLLVASSLLVVASSSQKYDAKLVDSTLLSMGITNETRIFDLVKLPKDVKLEELLRHYNPTYHKKDLNIFKLPVATVVHQYFSSSQFFDQKDMKKRINIFVNHLKEIVDRLITSARRYRSSKDKQVTLIGLTSLACLTKEELYRVTHGHRDVKLGSPFCSTYSQSGANRGRISVSKRTRGSLQFGSQNFGRGNIGIFPVVRPRSCFPNMRYPGIPIRTTFGIGQRRGGIFKGQFSRDVKIKGGVETKTRTRSCTSCGMC